MVKAGGFVRHLLDPGQLVFVAGVYCTSNVFLEYIMRPIPSVGPSMKPTFEDAGDIILGSYIPVAMDR